MHLQNMFGLCPYYHFLQINENECKKENKIDIIGLNYKDNHQNAKKFLNDLKSPYKIILKDLDGTIAIEWGAYGVPETFIIGEDGIIKDKIVGPITDEIINKRIDPLFTKNND